MKNRVEMSAVRVLAVVVLVVGSAGAQADELYGPEPERVLSCEVKKGYSVADSGELEEMWVNPDEPAFTVDRETGIALGSGKISSHEFNVTLIHPGEAEYGFSFEAVWIKEYDTGGTDVAILSIEVWSAGEEKPFIWTDAQFIYTGICGSG